MKGSELHTSSDEELRRLQMVLLEMLVEIDRVCRKNDVSYCLVMGTLLGAVRHGGFIPWDDDLDVAMLRSEYRKFGEACRRDLDQSRFLYQDHETDPHYRWGYARIRRKGSEFVRAGQEHMRMKTGIFVDIFPFDSVPNAPVVRALHCFYCFVLRKLLYAGSGRKSARTAALRLCYTILNVVPHGWVLRKVGRLAKGGKRTRLVRILTFPVPKGRPFGYLRDWFEELEDVNFEGRPFPGIRDYDGFLRFNYGDYLQLPPPEERVRCHPASKFQLPPDEPE